MHKDQISRALDICIKTLQSGGGLEQALKLFPQWRSELNPLIKSAYLVQQMGEAIQIPEPIILNHREGFLQAAQEIIPNPRKTRRRFPFRAFLWGAFLTVGLLLGVFGASLLFGRALPGSVFYPIKQSGRQARLLVTRNTIERIRLIQSFDQQRVKEMGILKQKSTQAAISFGGNLYQTPEGNWSVAGIPIRLQANTQLVGNIWGGIYVQISGVLQDDGTILAERIQAQQFLVQGVVESMTPEWLVIAGLPVMLTSDTMILGTLAPGARVEAITLLSSDDLFLARRVKVLSLTNTGSD